MTSISSFLWSNLGAVSNAQWMGIDGHQFHPRAHGVDHLHIPMCARVSIASVGTCHGIMCFDIGHRVSACLTRDWTLITHRLAIGNTHGAIGVIVGGEKESNGPVIVVVSYVLWIGEETDFEIAMRRRIAVLHQDTSVRMHFAASRARILLIVIIVLDHHSMTSHGGIAVGIDWIETIPNLSSREERHSPMKTWGTLTDLDFIDFCFRSEIFEENVLKHGAIPGRSFPQVFDFATLKKNIYKQSSNNSINDNNFSIIHSNNTKTNTQSDTLSP